MAVDPTEPELRPSDASLHWLKKWSKEHDASVNVVYVTSAYAAALSITKYNFSDYVESLHLGEHVQADVLVEETSSRRKKVDALLQYSKRLNANLIVVSSHGRSGPGRLVLGSFAESLLSESEVPVLFLSEHDGKNAWTNKVLFPCDFSDASKSALELFTLQSSPKSFELILFHAALPPGAVFDTGMMGVPVYIPESYWDEQKAWIEFEKEKLVKSMESKGFKVRFVVQEGVLNAASAIQRFAQDENVDLIAMSSVSRKLNLVTVGSVAKEIFRIKKWPVWVSGPSTQFQYAIKNLKEGPHLQSTSPDLSAP